MGQHSIPQYYLNGFTESAISSHIWTYEKGNSKYFRSTTESIANENNCWPESKETYLAERIEQPANFVIDKIRKRLLITQEEKQILASYMVIMILRVDKGLATMKEVFPEVVQEEFTKLEKEITDAIKRNPSKQDKLLALQKTLPEAKAKYPLEFPKKIWYENLTPEALPDVCKTLPQMTWIFVVSNRRNPFLTSDNPFFFFKGQGIKNPEAEITFPISSEITLLMTWVKRIKQFQYISAKETIIKEINTRTVSAATRYIYSSIEADWITNLAKRGKWSFNKIGLGPRS